MNTNPNPPESQPESQIFDSLRLELRRGCLILAVLAQLQSEHYGYTLRKALADQGLAIEESTLYPLLRRLETQQLLTSQWREEDKRNKRFYKLSPDRPNHPHPAPRRVERHQRLAPQNPEN